MSNWKQFWFQISKFQFSLDAYTYGQGSKNRNQRQILFFWKNQFFKTNFEKPKLCKNLAYKVKLKENLKNHVVIW